MDAMSESRVIRAPSRRRGRNDEQLCDRIKLKKVLGLTVCSNAALDVSPISGLLAYPAGCTVILFNAKKQTQVYLVNTSRKAFTSVAFSRCGRYVATGECGINPAIKVWELDSPNGNLENTTGGTVVAEFVDHKYAVTCVAFSPTGKYLVSVGSQHDMIVNVFEWKSSLKMASNKVSAKVSAVSFAEDGSYFVTVGNRHVKYWYLEGGRKYKDPIPLMGRSAILGELRNNDFCAVACGKGECIDSTYAITRLGHLVEFNSRRLLDKWVQCRTTSANCICVNGQFILVGCAESIIRIFNAVTLEYITTLPRTHYLGVDVAQGIHINHIMTVPHNAKYPDTIAMVYDEARAKVSCVYNDHSLYIWDMRDIKRVGKSHSFLYHSTCIWGVETVPYNIDRAMSHTLPEDCFLTCSSDDTIRVWGLNGCANNDIYRKNIYSKELLKVVYIDDELNFIKDSDNSVFSSDKSPSYDGRNGVRCIKISPELNHLASGDRSGNIRIYNLSNLKLVTTIEAHESEVLCLEYSNDKIDRKLLGSASRDRLIHVFDVSQDYLLLQTLDDHSSSITSIKFIGSGMNFQMISCGADKSIMFRTFHNNMFLRGTNCSGKTTLYDMEVDSNSKHILTACQDRNIRVYGTQNMKHTKTFKGSHSDDGSLIKLSLDPSGIYIATSCTDKTLAVYDYYSNECMARMYGHSELVTGLKFTNDCKHLISASGDGCIFVWQVPHDMIVTMQARLSQQRLRSGHPPLARPISVNANTDIIIESPTSDEHVMIDELPLTPGYKFSDVGQLPQWAKRKAAVNADSVVDTHQAVTAAVAVAAASQQSISNLSSSPSQVIGVPKARGRWAQRGQIDSDALDIRSNSESPLGITTPAYSSTAAGNTQTSDYNSGSSKDIMYNQTYLSEDSSIDSGMETRREIKFSGSNNSGISASNSGRITTDKKKNAGFRFESNNDHDGDVEDISDGERTSSEHGMFYTNISPATPTDFKVTAMNEEELRKSVRRQKFEKVGLNLSAGNGSSHTASTGTGTGTSDTEDEGSTPSGENADRSLASTLGGSSESIPQTSSSFLQAALDGPGTVLERGSSGRRSISAKHNNESNKSVPTITKSYTSTKKEELLKVISEAKQKLENGQRKNGIKKLNALPEVGYRPLRGSHSISDLSLAGTLEGSRPTGTPNRYTKTDVLHSNSNNTKTPTTNAQHFFNCAAPKSVLLKNCQAMRQVHQNYPPYPRHIGVYNSQSQQSSSQNFQKTSTLTTASQSKQCPGGASPQKCLPSSHLSLKSLSSKSSSAKCTNLEISTKPVDGEKTQHAKSPTSNTRKNYSILKNYKSCPVSPVHEEIDWRNLPRDSNNIIFTEPKRHSVYSDDAKTILDMIHSDTEKMIEEITRKYGDLDEVPRNQQLEKNLELSHPESGTTKTSKEDPSSSKDEDSNFSSDSLENCSLDLDYDQKPHPHPRKKKSVCRKHQKSRNTVPPKRSASEYYIFQEYYQTSVHRNVSLSDILNDGNEAADDRTEEAKFLETQRHSSASFFLTSQYPEYPEQKSQESLLSEELFDESYCNSMESILSDESDCKSAPLEMLFDKTSTTKKISNPYTSFIQGQLDNALVSKSYGSSPNAYNSFDYYMQQKSLHSSPYDSFDVSSYNLDNFCDNKRKIKPYKKKSHNERLQSSETYPRLADYQAKSPITTTDDEQIPTLSFKNEQYSSGVNKSLSKDFAYQRNRKQHQSNPISSALDSDEYENFIFSKKVVKPKPPIPAKPQNLTSTLSTHEMRATTTTCGDIKSCSSSSPSPSIKKSCSFDIDTKDLRNKSRTASVVQKFEKNLKKFENEKENEQKLYQGMLRPSVSSGALATSCLKKTSKFSGSSGGYSGTTQCTATGTPAAPSRRASSMRSRSRPKISVRFNTVSQIKYTPNERRSSSCSSPSSASATTTTTRLLNDINSNATTLQQYHHHDHVHNVHRNEPLPQLPPPPRPSSSSSSTAHFSDYEEKSFEMYIAENGNEHENNMDSLKLYIKPENSSLQSVAAIADIDEMHYDKSKKNLENEKTLDTSTSNQCKNIAKKIDLINKLIEMEERKLEQIRLATESRMKPFECNSKKKGYVKSLTMNFDMLARGIEKDIENERKKQAAADAADSRPSDGSSYFRMKRNVSLPDVLESTKMKTYNDDANNDNNTEEHESEKIRNDCDEKDKGNPKSLLPMPIEESSIRRACSLSDLHMGNMGKANNKSMNLTPGQLQKSGVIHRASSASRSASKRNSLQGLKGLSGSGLGSQQQSTSMSVLIQGSDSETEDTNRGLLRSSGSGQNRSNGPIAAARQYGNKTSATNSSRRKGVQNFNNASGQQDDSSSEETQGGSSAHSGKPIVPPRPRNLPIDHKKAILNSSNVVKSRGIYEAGDFPLRDIEGSENSSQVYNVINKLFTTTTAAVQLHAKLKNTEDSTSSSNNLMLKELENALIMAQNMLTNITNKNEKTNLQHMSPSAYSTGEQATLENGDYLTMVNNCADLLSNVRSKHKSDDCENNA